MAHNLHADSLQAVDYLNQGLGQPPMDPFSRSHRLDKAPFTKMVPLARTWTIYTLKPNDQATSLSLSLMSRSNTLSNQHYGIAKT